MLKNIRNGIERRRNSKSILWRRLVSLKDFLWQCKNKYEDILSSLKDILSSLKMKRIDSLSIPNSPDEIRIFMNVRNESLHLPYLFKYYKKMGVDRFFIIDNDSTDETLPFLLSQKNTHVFRTKESYKKANGGHRWLKFLLSRYGKEHWCLVVDPDEILTYPNYKKVSIRKLCRFLEKEGSTALSCLLLDMYANKPIRLAQYNQGVNPLPSFPYFDKNTHHIERGPIPECSNAYFYAGGVRKRVFGIKPCLNKIPLFKFKSSVSLCRGHHFISGADLSSIEGAVLHFMFTSNFISKASEEAKREMYFNNSKWYKACTKKITENLNLNLYYPGSIKFKNSRQLVNLKITKTSKAFEAFTRNNMK